MRGPLLGCLPALHQATETLRGKVHPQVKFIKLAPCFNLRFLRQDLTVSGQCFAGLARPSSPKIIVEGPIGAKRRVSKRPRKFILKAAQVSLKSRYFALNICQSVL
mmetsp:Transcript_8418/g.12330  ORF Transcript_8418/g.12330 Transcript_8418/m.12330 type:complete len:106 (-) Transcript_8418:274-591(-)